MMRKHIMLVLLLLGAAPLQAQSADETPDRRAALVQSSIRGALTYHARADSALSKGDTAQVRKELNQLRGRLRATETNVLVLRVLVRDFVTDTVPAPLPPPASPIPPVVIDTLRAEPPGADDPPPIVIVEPDANPSDAPEPAPFDTTAPRMHVVEDIRAVGNELSLRFRPGWEKHDSIQATTTAGTLARSGLTWRLSSSTSAQVCLKVWQTLPNAFGRLITTQQVYCYWVQVGNPREYVIPATIDATGDTDVCASNDNRLEKWLASLPNGSVIRGRDGARYRCDYGLTLTDRWNLSFVGSVTLFTDYEASPIQDSGRQGFRLLEFDRGGNISIEGWTIRGPRHPNSELYLADRETQHGLDFNGTNGVSVRNVRVENVQGDFVCLCFSSTRWGQGLFVSEPTRHVEISNSEFRNAGRQGIAMTGLYDARIHNNEFGEVQRSLWDFEPGGLHEWVKGVDVYSNRITGRIRNNVVAGHGSGIYVQDITIRDNDLGPKGFRMHFGGNVYRRGLRILRNVSHVELSSTDSPIEISGFDDVEVVGNTILMQSRRQKPAVLIQNQRCACYLVEGNAIQGGRVQVRWEAERDNPNSVVIEDGVPVNP